MKKKNNTENDKNKEEKKNNKIIIKILIIICSIIFVLATAYLIYYFCNRYANKNNMKELQNYMPEVANNSESKETATMIKVRELQKENEDIKGWIEIENTHINYPILQNDDNEYYVYRDYRKEESSYGSIYMKDKSDINDANSNLVIYGHHMKDGEMFADLLEYVNEEFYQEHKIVKITTENEEREYEIIATFKSRVFYEDEKNVFRYYNITNFENEDEYNNFVINSKKNQFYDTGIDASYGEQLITLITCEYSQENGRMVVVAKRIK